MPILRPRGQTSTSGSWNSARRDTRTRCNSSPMLMNGSAVRSTLARTVTVPAADASRTHSLLTSVIIMARAATASGNRFSCGLCLVSINYERPHASTSAPANFPVPPTMPVAYPAPGSSSIECTCCSQDPLVADAISGRIIRLPCGKPVICSELGRHLVFFGNWASMTQ